ncbi:MAG: sigma-54-dependent Fis family transcriptional regulator [Muricauda sp.]|nr:sigma-54 dependent transcriptional regulator [Allomuricauda sp.]MBO6532604.1 sigma-54-dependent Fis family transcriptional regulator [Allomuricauda sp.]MBO6587959.1 sigma-54-dependent Fis family transcriptional regulator [Allomuricauda sp.]MBO6617584.1 sigma-54-dependent Fis family transcriptional regulator [Allomuricauda sp.]MBO6643405.1 sigma-54-dependent Fis family transcriptional regulator [Allomuricauda sp.]MBO6745919.1 sigma-54-dependent Fis family transcriptional regulator [Allomuric
MLKKENILLVDDDIDILELLQRHLKSMNYHTYKAVSVKEALYILKDTEIDLLVTDINMPEIDGLELVKYVTEHYPDMPKLVVTGFPSAEDASKVIKHGATDYLTKPFTKVELETAVKRAFASKTNGQTFKRPPKPTQAANGFDGMIGDSQSFQKVTQIIERVKDNRATVLVSGESGTGKELVARAIHYSGKFARAPFIAVNCGAIPEGLLEAELFGYTKGAFTGANENRDGFFQAAQNGTIFLDEIGNAPLGAQNRLLRVLQEKEVTKVGSQKAEKLEVRVIAATNSDLEELIRKKTFREDLFYRLSVVTVEVPPLRERPSDIPLLVEQFLQKYGLEYKDRFVRISDEALEVLKRYSWPGNIRELENVVQRAVIMCDGEITLQHLPDVLKYKIDFPKKGFKTLHEKEKEYIEEVLLFTQGNKTKAAEILGINRKTLREKLK